MSIMDQIEETETASTNLERKSIIEDNIDAPDVRGNSKVDQIPE